MTASAFSCQKGEPTDDKKVSRREFLRKSAAVAASTAALSSSALSYSRIVGANDRIALGHIGVGVRGRELQGFNHSVACIMAARSYETGRKLYWDPKAEEILEHPPA